MTDGLAFMGEPVENVRHDMARDIFTVELDFSAEMMEQLGEGIPISGQLGISVHEGRLHLELRQSLDFRLDRPLHKGPIQ